MWRQRLLAKAIRERETRKLLARPPEPATRVEKETIPVQRRPAAAS
jgi:hypothetical protein